MRHFVILRNFPTDESSLIVHHKRYLTDTEPWDYPDELLVTLCENCHTEEYETRKANEQELIEILKNRFYADDLKELCNGFLNLEIFRDSGVVACVISWALSDSEIQAELINRYFAGKKGNNNAKG